MIERAIPVLHVADAAAAEDFYCRLLGFRIEFRAPDRVDDAGPAYVGISRDGALLHLSSHAGDAVAGGVAFLLVDDVDTLYEEFRGNGVSIHLTPTDQSWGMREMYVRDPDGNTLRFGAPPRD